MADTDQVLKHGYPEEVEEVDYSEEEVEYRDWLIRRLSRAREIREDAHVEFDGMTYEEYYESNAKAANSYIPPRKNLRDTRIVTGTTLEKVATLISSVLNLVFEPNLTAYNEKNEIVSQLGETMEALIRKSRDVEAPGYDVKRPLIYKELLDQGTCFVEDVMVEWREVEKKLRKNSTWAEGIELKKNWSEKFSKTYREIRSNLLEGTSVYLGNIKEFYLEYQPYVFVRELIPYEEAQKLYGEWERFKHVPATIQHFSVQPNHREYRHWNLIEFKPGFVEVIKYQDKPKNEYQVLLNGVLMLPIGFPLSALTGKRDYSIAKGDVSPIGRFFAYSKSIPAKTKVDQAVLDEFYKVFIRKTQKSLAPPMANNTGKTLTSKIFDPAIIVNDIDPNRLVEIGTNDGVSSAEFSMFELISQTIDKKSVSPVFEGQPQSGEQTATEIVELKKQSMQKLGLVMWGISNLEKKMSWLRLYNIIKYWTEAEDLRANKFRGQLQDVFKKIEVEDSFEDGTSGTRVIEFRDKVPESGQLLAEQKLTKKTTGRNVKKIVIKPEDLRNADLTWKITIVPTEKESDALDKAQFTASVAEGFQLFGPQSFNMEYLKRQWAQKNKLDPDQALVSQEEMQARMQQAQAQAQAQEAQQQQRGRGRPGGNTNDQLRQGRRATGGRADQTGQNASSVQKMVRK
jgi:hypothetical protein|tara:strand:+ start:3598 stop:5643 length:2046 start_codon:yes stop_codon:yes gene_type:complete